MAPPKPGPDTIIPERAPRLVVPLRFFITGILFFFGLFLVALWKAPMLVADYLHNSATLAVTHLFTLGFGSTVVMGAIYQMTPVLLYSTLYSERWADLHLVIHAPGVLAMVIGFLEYEPTWVIWGGSAVLTGAVLFLANLIATYAKAESWNWHGYLMAGAVVFYLSTLTWGVVMALNQRYGFLGEVEGAHLNFHLTLGLLGWFSLMIIGVGLKLIPMFAPAKTLPVPVVMANGLSLVIGVGAILLGLYTYRALLWIGTVVVCASLLGYVVGVWYTFLHRRKGALDFSVRFAVTAAATLPLPVLGLWIAGRQMKAGLVFFFALAFIGGTILGMLMRIIPFMVWLHRFRNRAHKLERIPFLHQMFDPRWGYITYGAWFPGTLVMALGLGLSSTPVLITGALICLVALGSLSVMIAQVMRHARRPPAEQGQGAGQGPRPAQGPGPGQEQS